MKRIGDTALVVIVTFVASLILNGVVQYVTRDSGSVVIGHAIPGSETVYVPVEIVNFSNDVIDGFQLAVPSTTRTDDLAASAPLQVSELHSAIPNQLTKVVAISGIEPRSRTSVLIPVASSTEAQLVHAVNGRELGLRLTHAAEVENPVLAAAGDALIVAILYSLFYGGFLFWTYGRIDGIRQDLKEVEEKQAKGQEMAIELSESLEQQGKEARERALRLKVLLLARLDDYARELRFWRDAIRGILLKGGADPVTQELVIEIVTEKLKTFSTREAGTEDEFRTIFVLAGLLNEANNERRE